MECKEYRAFLHEYLDDDLADGQVQELFSHIDQCENCRVHLESLQKTERLLKNQAPIKAPADFTKKVMARLPKESFLEKVSQWVKRHPMAVAAASFMILMAGSFVSVGEDGRVYLTSSAHLVEQIEVIDKTVKWIWNEIQSMFK